MTSTRARLVGAGALVVVASIAVVLLLQGSGAPSNPSANDTAAVATSAAAPTATAAESDAESTKAADGPTGEPSPTQDSSPAGAGQDGAPEDPLSSLDPVGVDETADFGTGVTARLVDLAAIRGEGVARGEVGGPALLVTIRLQNEGADVIPLSSVVVNAYHGSDATPAVALFTDERSDPLAGSLEPGGSARGTYVFVVPRSDRDSLLVTVSYEAGEPLVAFTGSAPS